MLKKSLIEMSNIRLIKNHQLGTNRIKIPKVINMETQNMLYRDPIITKTGSTNNVTKFHLNSRLVFPLAMIRLPIGEPTDLMNI